MAGYGTGGSWSSPSQLLIAPLAPRGGALALGTPGFWDLQGAQGPQMVSVVPSKAVREKPWKSS
jgi:hypothetical protein